MSFASGLRFDYFPSSDQPRRGRLGVQPHQQMQVIVQNREPAHGDAEDFRKFVESGY